MLSVPHDPLAVTQIIHKGKKLAEGDVLPPRPCTLLVIENATAGAVDVGADGQKGARRAERMRGHFSG